MNHDCPPTPYSTEHEPDGRASRPQKSAREKIMDLLARRDHSEKELRRKLSTSYSTPEIEHAIEECVERGWLAAPDELARRVYDQLSRKNKSSRYIARFLRSKGLPTVPMNTDLEFEKARQLIRSKLRSPPPYTYPDQIKIQRYLANRGFDEQTIRNVMYEKP